jgi:hypothetical protein
MIMSPFALAGPGRPLALAWNGVIAGIVVLLLAIWSAVATPVSRRLVR